MKRLLIVLTAIFMSLNFIACGAKKNNKTRLTLGAGRANDVANTPTGNGWDILNRSGAEEDILGNQDPHAAAVAFMGGDSEFVGRIFVNSIQIQLKFNGNQIDSYNSRVGIRFYDEGTQPYGYYLGPEARTSIKGYRNGSDINVTFNDGVSDVIVKGVISGYSFKGNVTYGDGQFLGSFDLPSSSIY